MTEEFYLASNECTDGEFAVLWMSNSGDQLEDSISRLHPIAWARYEDFLNDDAENSGSEIIGAALLYAVVGLATKFWGSDYYLGDMFVKGPDRRRKKLFAMVFRAAIAGNPIPL